MKTDFMIYPERRLVVARFSDTIAYEDIIHCFDQGIGHKDFSKHPMSIFSTVDAAEQYLGQKLEDVLQPK